MNVRSGRPLKQQARILESLHGVLDGDRLGLPLAWAAAIL